MNINDEIQKEKERCFHLAVKIAQSALIAWPESVDSQLWNQRVNRMIDNLIVQFEVDGENQ